MTLQRGLPGPDVALEVLPNATVPDDTGGETLAPGLARGLLRWPPLPISADEKLERCMNESPQSHAFTDAAAAPARKQQPPFDSQSPAMLSVLKVLTEVAGHDVPVLLRGESGTGKSVAARALHQASSRSARAFVTVDCTALASGVPPSSRTDPVTEADLAGERAFRSHVATAVGGTILLQEIAALPARLQEATLRLAAERRRAGRRPRARLVASTERDLDAAVASGLFRKDLLFRLNVVEIALPPLRERPEDILPLALHFLETLGRAEGLTVPDFTARAQRALLAYSWPGNIRELRNAVQRGLVLSASGALDVDALPERIAAAL
jgi:NtrC-family two-component system response regulator AlgB